jgi:hypothetical protein
MESNALLTFDSQYHLEDTLYGQPSALSYTPTSTISTKTNLQPNDNGGFELNLPLAYRPSLNTEFMRCKLLYTEESDRIYSVNLNSSMGVSEDFCNNFIQSFLFGRRLTAQGKAALKALLLVFGDLCINSLRGGDDEAIYTLALSSKLKKKSDLLSVMRGAPFV